MFKRSDHNMDGSLDWTESIGLFPRKEEEGEGDTEAAQLVARIDADGDGLVSQEVVRSLPHGKT